MYTVSATEVYDCIYKELIIFFRYYARRLQGKHSKYKERGLGQRPMNDILQMKHKPVGKA